jgi:hypothetical protein
MARPRWSITWIISDGRSFPETSLALARRNHKIRQRELGRR